MKIIWMTAGLIALGLGTLGIVVPFLPATPLYLFAAFCFMKSSTRLHQWFLTTSLYRNYAKDLAEKRSMTKSRKIHVMCMITAVMSIAFVLMHNVVIGRIFLVIVWIGHILYFTYRIKTDEETKL